MTWEGLTPPYRTIVADPPWDYGNDATRWPSSSMQRPVSRKPFAYSAMSLEDIAALDVSALAARDCRLFLWTTNRHLFECASILTAWGFVYRQTLVWHKQAVPPFGGSVAPNFAEFLLVATRGKPRVITRAPSSVIRATKPTVHSTKPDAFGDLIETVSEGPYVELFARRQRLGWDSWGFGYEAAS